MIARILTALLLLACSCAGPGSAGKGAADAGVAELLEVERAFVGTAADRGTREAFKEYVADDAVAFKPNPVNARKWYEENGEDSGLLSWEPSYVEVSSSGDLGYTTGPWEFRRNAGDAEPVSTGHYVSVWKRNAGGEWRLALDLGNVNPPVRERAAGVETKVVRPLRPALSTEAAVEREREVLMATDRRFSDESKANGVVAAYMSFSTDDIRLYRMGEPPHQGKTRVRKALLSISGTVTWEPSYADVSAAGDLGYTYGAAELCGEEPGAVVETESYVRVWRIDSEGRWSVALDIALPSGVAAREGEESIEEEEAPNGSEIPR